MKTPLYDAHVRSNGRMVDFAGWDMPVRYEPGIIAEHNAVRTGAGIFDVSHMGQIRFEGPDALAVVNRLISNDLAKVGIGRAQYATICKDDGGILDDAISYRLSDTEILMVVNASNVGKIAAWFEARADGAARPVNVSSDWAMIALQGPKAPEILARVFPDCAGMKPFRVLRTGEHIVATTGYTGEPGCEILVPPAHAEALWDRLLGEGAAPAGLGARDTLRLEMGYALYGNDIDEGTNPLEAGLGWVTVLDKAGGFIGRDAIVAARDAGIWRHLVDLDVTGRRIARHDHEVCAPGGGPVIGRVTSGTMSPTLGRAIAMAYVTTEYSAPGATVEVDVRGRRIEAVVTRPPFYKKSR